MTAGESSTTGMEPKRRQLVATSAAFSTALAIAFAGYIVFEGVPVAAVAGLLSGSGTYFVLQYVLSGTLAESGSAPQSTRPASGSQTSGGLHSGAAGFALDLGGVTTFALGFVFETQIAIPILGGPAAALAGYVVLEQVLPRPR